MPPNTGDGLERAKKSDDTNNLLMPISPSSQDTPSKERKGIVTEEFQGLGGEDVSCCRAQDDNDRFQTPMYLVICAYIPYIFTFVVSWTRELIYGVGPLRGRSRRQFIETSRHGYVPLFTTFENFYVRNMYRRISNAFGNVLSSGPGATINVIERISEDDNWTFQLKKTSEIKCINLASNNYLGFAEREGHCIEQAISALTSHNMSFCSSYQELGRSQLHTKLERTIANYVGVDDSIACGMGFATNAQNIPCLVSKGCLVMSDEFNHSSIALGIRLSGATVKVFKHNNSKDLEQTLRRAIMEGQPRTHRPWKKILVIVEGIYSMDASICCLPEIIAIKKKYGAYLYVDEAHSIGAIGPNGRGIVDHFGLNPRDVDLLMGTFTKSFGGAGGYIAGSKSLINYLRMKSPSKIYSNEISPPVAYHIISSLDSIIRNDFVGMGRIKNLRMNTRYFRKRLKQMGFVVYGCIESPLVPVMLFNGAKIPAFVTECLKRGVAVVGVGFPATKITEDRLRLCVSASHTKEMLDDALEVIHFVGKYTNCLYNAKA